MKLYIVNGSPNARKCQAVVNHLGLNPEIVAMDFFNGSLKQDDYLGINPNGRVPALVDGDLKLFESEAINMYLCTEKSPDHKLFDLKLRPQIVQWIFWSINHYNRHLGAIVWEQVIKPNFFQQETDPAAMKESIEFFEGFAKILDEHLNGRQFMVGDDWTLADYSIGHMEFFIDMLPIDLKKHKNIYAFYERLRDNPHWLATNVPMDQMGKAA